jgi:hypothetical protein
MERDYSGFINKPSKPEDDRPFWLRLLSSIRPSIFFDCKKDKDTEDTKRGIGIQIKGGAEF